MVEHYLKEPLLQSPRATKALTLATIDVELIPLQREAKWTLWTSLFILTNLAFSSWLAFYTPAIVSDWMPFAHWIALGLVVWSVIGLGAQLRLKLGLKKRAALLAVVRNDIANQLYHPAVVSERLTRLEDAYQIKPQAFIHLLLKDTPH